MELRFQRSAGIRNLEDTFRRAVHGTRRPSLSLPLARIRRGRTRTYVYASKHAESRTILESVSRVRFSGRSFARPSIPAVRGPAVSASSPRRPIASWSDRLVVSPSLRLVASPFRGVREPREDEKSVSSRYSWGSRIARGLVTRLRTHLLLDRRLKPSVHQATILLISARIGPGGKCPSDCQFTLPREPANARSWKSAIEFFVIFPSDRPRDGAPGRGTPRRRPAKIRRVTS